MNEEAKFKIVKARTTLLLQHFFWGRLALYLEMVENLEIPTLAVDGKRIFYNPKFILDLADDLVQSAIAHEVCHCMFDHIGRRSGRNPMVWNMAGDYAINQIIKDAKFRIGDGWLLDPKFQGMAAEQIYDLLTTDPDLSDKTALCDIMDGPEGKGSPADIVAQAMEWKVAVMQAAHEAHKRGKLPESMKRFVDEILAPKVSWRETLQQFITQTARDDYSWARPNRLFAASGMYMPSLYSQKMGPVVIAVDTSGSIDDKTLAAFAAECQAVMDQARPEKTKVIYCDAAVNHVDEYLPGDQIVLSPYGGGGTSFVPPFKLLEREGETPAAMIYLTDMLGEFPSEPEFPVLWCATTDVQGPFGQTVRIEL